MVTSKGVIRDSIKVDREEVDRADGITVQKLITEKHGSEKIRMRKFTMEPEGSMVFHKHSNTEHIQYVLKGVIEVTIEDETHTVREGSAIFIPKGASHSYKNIGKIRAQFLCMVPTVDIETEVIE